MIGELLKSSRSGPGAARNLLSIKLAPVASLDMSQNLTELLAVCLSEERQCKLLSVVVCRYQRCLKQCGVVTSELNDVGLAETIWRLKQR